MSNTMVYFQSKFSFFLVLKVHFIIDWTLFNFVFQFSYQGKILSARSHTETEDITSSNIARFMLVNKSESE